MHIDIPKRFKNAQVPEANTEGLIRHNRCVSYATHLREVPQSVMSYESVFFLIFQNTQEPLCKHIITIDECVGCNIVQQTVSSNL